MGLVRADRGFVDGNFFGTAEQVGLIVIVMVPLTSPIQRFGRHSDALWQLIEGPEMQELEGEGPGRSLIVIR